MKKYIQLTLILVSLTCFNVLSQESSENRSEYFPDIFGILKTKAEYDLDNHLMRFEVRNARFGAIGKINDYMSYKLGNGDITD